MQTSKSEMISFRVTKEDKDLLRKNCQAAGYGENLSKYLLEKEKEQSVPYAKIQRATVKYLYREIEFLKTLDEKIFLVRGTDGLQMLYSYISFCHNWKGEGDLLFGGDRTDGTSHA